MNDLIVMRAKWKKKRMRRLKRKRRNMRQLSNNKMLKSRYFSLCHVHFKTLQLTWKFEPAILFQLSYRLLLVVQDGVRFGRRHVEGKHFCFSLKFIQQIGLACKVVSLVIHNIEFVRYDLQILVIRCYNGHRMACRNYTPPRV